MKIALIGPGAVGVVIAADLARKMPVYLVCKHQEIVEKVSQRGLRVTGVNGDYTVAENLFPVRTVEELPDDLDAVLIATKCPDVVDLVYELKSKLKPQATIVTLQNGLIEDEVSRIVKPAMVSGCVVSFGATLLEPGVAEKTSHGEIVLGRLNGVRTAVDSELIAGLSATEPCAWTGNILGYKYSKLLINANISSLGAVSGLLLGEMMERKWMRLAFLSIMTEGVRVARMAGLRLEALNGLHAESLMLRPELFYKGFFGNIGGRLAYQKRQLILKIIGRKYKNLRSSSLQSLERGRPTEVDYLNGYIVKLGARFRTATPLNSFVLETIHEIEKGDAKSSLRELEKVEARACAVWGVGR